MLQSLSAEGRTDKKPARRLHTEREITGGMSVIECQLFSLLRKGPVAT